MSIEYFEDKKPFLVFAFILNALIMVVMGIIIWGENLGIADRVVKFCRFVFIVNNIVCAVYIVIILLLTIRFVLDHGSMWLNKGETTYKYTIARESGIESDRNLIRRGVKIQDFIKDPVIIYSVLFLVFSVLTFVFYFTISPLTLTIGSFVIAIIMGILFLVKSKNEMKMVARSIQMFAKIFLLFFILAIVILLVVGRL